MPKLNIGGAIFLFLCAVFLLIGGIGYRQVIAQDMGVFAGIILVFIAWLLNTRRLILPPYFWVYIGFTAIVGWDIMTRGNSFYSPKFFSLMLGGGFFWLAFFTVMQSKYELIIRKYLPIILTILGYVFFVGYLWYRKELLYLDKFSFGFVIPLTLEHWHIGVFWSLLLLLLLPYLPKDNKYPWYFVFTLLIGIYLVVVSQARSSYLGILVGVIVYFKGQFGRFHINSKRLRLLVIGLISVMLIITSFKPIRSLYFLTPGILNLQRMPMGSGIGRYKEVTSFYAYRYRSTDYITTSSHNIFLEMIAGLGWIGFVFLIWFILTCKTFFGHKWGGNIWLALFSSLSVIFLVDPGYSIPTLYWLWMISLGIAQGKIYE